MPTNPISDIMSFVSRSDFVIPNAIWLLLVVAVLWLILTRKKEEKFKRKSTIKDMKNELKLIFKLFGKPLNKRIDSGMTTWRHGISYIPFYWDQNKPLSANIKTSRQMTNFLRKNPDKAKVISTYKRDGKEIKVKGIKPDIVEMYIIKVCDYKFIGKTLSKLGVGINYLVVSKNILEKSKDVIQIQPNLLPNVEFNIIFFENSARQFVENVVYKLNREEELDEFRNQIPKQNYLEVSTAGLVARAREKATIEKAKYKGQIEGAEGG